MAREKFHTLTEQMFYILLCLTKEQCGTDIMAAVSALTDGRVNVGPVRSITCWSSSKAQA